MTREEGLKQIDEADWVKDDPATLDLWVTNKDDQPVHAWLQMRPVYCDRGHIKLLIDMPGRFGMPELDEADSFPRYFFSFTEADMHTRAFLKWRLWKERLVSDSVIREVFAG